MLHEVQTPTPIEQSVWADGALNYEQAGLLMGGKSRFFIRRLVVAGKLTAAQLGRTRVVPRRQVLEYIKTHEIEPAIPDAASPHTSTEDGGGSDLGMDRPRGPHGGS